MTVALPQTAGWGTMATQTIPMPALTGEHTVFVKYNGGYGVDKGSQCLKVSDRPGNGPAATTITSVVTPGTSYQVSPWVSIAGAAQANVLLGGESDGRDRRQLGEVERHARGAGLHPFGRAHLRRRARRRRRRLLVVCPGASTEAGD